MTNFKQKINKKTSGQVKIIQTELLKYHMSVTKRKYHQEKI